MDEIYVGENEENETETEMQNEEAQIFEDITE